MASKQRKYLPLKSASKSFGYTTAELRNLIKIGLVSARKVKGQLCIKADAFEHMNIKAEKPQAKNVKNKNMALAQRNYMKLVPFTKPSGTLVKILEPTAFAAVAAMVLYLGMMPGFAYPVVSGIATVENAVAIMGDATYELIENSAQVPGTVEDQLALVAAKPAEILAEMILPTAGKTEGMVAGASIGTSHDSVAAGKSFVYQAVEDMLNGIADGAQKAEAMLGSLNRKFSETIIDNLTFEKLDPMIQNTFKL